MFCSWLRKKRKKKVIITAITNSHWKKGIELYAEMCLSERNGAPYIHVHVKLFLYLALLMERAVHVYGLPLPYARSNYKNNWASNPSWKSLICLFYYIMGNRLQVDYRLPTALLPLHYKILLHPDLKTGQFVGQETITIKVIEATKQIILHSNRLTITNVSVVDLAVGRWKLDSDLQFLIINMMQELTVDAEIDLTIFFEGYTRKKTIGLYSRTYKTPEGLNR